MTTVIILHTVIVKFALWHNKIIVDVKFLMPEYSSFQDKILSIWSFSTTLTCTLVLVSLLLTYRQWPHPQSCLLELYYAGIAVGSLVGVLLLLLILIVTVICCWRWAHVICVKKILIPVKWFLYKIIVCICWKCINIVLKVNNVNGSLILPSISRAFHRC